MRKLVAEKEDPTLMTKEEFFAKIERAEKQPGKSFQVLTSSTNTYAVYEPI